MKRLSLPRFDFALPRHPPTEAQLLERVSKGLAISLPKGDALTSLDLEKGLADTKALLRPEERAQLEGLAKRLAESEKAQGKKYVVSQLAEDGAGRRAPITLHFSYEPGEVPAHIRPYAQPDELVPKVPVLMALPKSTPEEDAMFERFQRNNDAFLARAEREVSQASASDADWDAGER